MYCTFFELINNRLFPVDIIQGRRGYFRHQKLKAGPFRFHCIYDTSGEASDTQEKFQEEKTMGGDPREF